MSLRKVFRGLCVSMVVSAVGCSPEVEVAQSPTESEQYIQQLPFRREVLERDLTSVDNEYADTRLTKYGLEGAQWEILETWDPPSRALTVAEADGVPTGQPLEGTLTFKKLTPDPMPETEAEWIALGERVFFDYPIRLDSIYSSLLEIEDGWVRGGLIADQDNVVGLRLIRDEETGSIGVGITCALCHASRDEGGEVSGVLASREIDIGAARLLVMGLTPGELPKEIDSTAVGDLDRLGPGRTDVLNDGIFNPFAIPDFGGIVDVPYLQHNANWFHRQTTTMAIRCETLFITSNGERTRPPRVLMYALASYFRSLPPPSPSVSLTPTETKQGEAVFAAAFCDQCHTPPLFTSDRQVSVMDIGTDPAAGTSASRQTGYYRIPSLRGVGRAAPYLHDGAFASLEDMFDPDRAEPGHPYGLELSEEDRATLLLYLRSL